MYRTGRELVLCLCLVVFSDRIGSIDIIGSIRIEELDAAGIDLRDPALRAVALKAARPQRPLDVDRAALLQATFGGLGLRSPRDHLVPLGVELRRAVCVAALVLVDGDADTLDA